MIFGGSTSCARRVMTRTVFRNKTNLGDAQIVVAMLVGIIALMPAPQHVRATCRARHDLAKRRDIEGNNQSQRPVAHSSQAGYSHMWDIS